MSFENANSAADEESGVTAGINITEGLQFDYTATREAAETLKTVRKNRNKQLPTRPAKLDSQTNFMLEVSHIAAQNVDGVKLGSSIKSSCGRYIYHLSIIDYLQKYDYKKKVERWQKIWWKHADASTISSIDANSYSKRFMAFVEELVLDYDFNHHIEQARETE